MQRKLSTRSRAEAGRKFDNGTGVTPVEVERT